MTTAELLAMLDRHAADLRRLGDERQEAGAAFPSLVASHGHDRYMVAASSAEAEADYIRRTIKELGYTVVELEPAAAMRTPAEVAVSPNGMVGVYDDAGQQIPELQGRWVDQMRAIAKVYQGEVDFLGDGRESYPFWLEHTV